jgi:hypothetical protein
MYGGILYLGGSGYSPEIRASSWYGIILTEVLLEGVHVTHNIVCDRRAGWGR